MAGSWSMVLWSLIEDGGHTTVVSMASIEATTIMQKLQAAALDMRSLRRPKLSIEKYGLGEVSRII